jgi:hypothetical protein
VSFSDWIKNVNRLKHLFTHRQLSIPRYLFCLYFFFVNQLNGCLSSDIWAVVFIYERSADFLSDLVCVPVTFTRSAAPEDEMQSLRLPQARRRRTSSLKDLSAGQICWSQRMFQLNSNGTLLCGGETTGRQPTHKSVLLYFSDDGVFPLQFLHCAEGLIELYPALSRSWKSPRNATRKSKYRFS